MRKISIIVPIYNAEKFLSRCVNSVLNQNYENIEVILVDDGSIDKSGKICDEYAKKDKRIRVIHQKNSGVSAARNTGIDNATGDYIEFLDSDDEILPNLYNDLIPCIENNGLDILVFNSQRVKDNKIKTSKHTGKFYIDNKYNALIKEFSNDGGCVWNKIYKRKVVENVRFPEGRLFEDTATGYRFIENADTVGYIDKVYYNYYYNSNSITNTSFNVRNRWDYVLAREEVFLYCVDKKLPCNKANSFLLKALLSCLTAIYANNVSDEYLEETKLKIRKYRNSNSYVNLGFKYKLFLYCFDKVDAIHILSAKTSKWAKRIQSFAKNLKY